MEAINYIVVQAGGKGTRMQRLTRNKPKALVPVENLPMLFHLFHKYPHSHFIIIGDYKIEVLRRYLAAFAKVDYTVVPASGHTGTCSGLKQALEYIPAMVPFLLIWSDLILPADFRLPTEAGTYIGIAKDFRCRWLYQNGEFFEQPSHTQGVAGLFVFTDKEELTSVPEDGELVRWLSEQGLTFRELPLYHAKEYGLIEEYEKLPKQRCRPFNRITVDGDWVIKEGIDEQGQRLACREQAWYQKLKGYHFTNLPKITSLYPLRMERIQGKNIYEYKDLTYEQKANVLRGLIQCLQNVQSLESSPSDYESYYEAYIGKTFSRLEVVRELIPFADRREIVVNGRRCRNVFLWREELENKMKAYFPKVFRLIHGDCTFSNIMLRETDGLPVLIDPRGYFGTTEFLGDPAYDWAKIYYSLVGNYDQFNLKRFDLGIGDSEVTLKIESNGWESLENEFFLQLNGRVRPEQIKLIHAIIWLSLTTYAWEDYDSICGAFYNGVYYLEEVL